MANENLKYIYDYIEKIEKAIGYNVEISIKKEFGLCIRATKNLYGDKVFTIQRIIPIHEINFCRVSVEEIILQEFKREEKKIYDKEILSGNFMFDL